MDEWINFILYGGKNAINLKMMCLEPSHEQIIA